MLCLWTYVHRIAYGASRQRPMKINSMHDMASTIRGRRQDLGLSQARLAARAGVSREWVNSFEGGKPTVEFGLVIRLLDALDLVLDVAPRGPDAGASAREQVDLDAFLEEYGNR